MINITDNTSPAQRGRDFISTLLDRRRAELDEEQSLALRKVAIKSADLERETLLARLATFTTQERCEFARAAVFAAREYVALWPSRSDALVYRTFDDFDTMFGLSYSDELTMRRAPAQQERLYEGAGLGVQTCYSSLLRLLAHLRPAPGAHLVDLGSGYGRLGFLTGLLYPHVRFSGYEFVAHRVERANAVAARFGISEQVRFIQQDLGQEGVVLPLADTYYMFDPFCPLTYERVLAQLVRIGARRAITIVTKGEAARRVREALALSGGAHWAEPELADDGFLTFFRTQTSLGGVRAGPDLSL